MTAKNKFFLISGLVLISVISVSNISFCFIARKNSTGDTASLEDQFQKILLDREALKASLDNISKTNEYMDHELSNSRGSLDSISSEYRRERQKNKGLEQKLRQKDKEIEEIKARILIYQEHKIDLLKELDLMTKALEDKKLQSSAVLALKNELEEKVKMLEEKITDLSMRKNSSTYLGTIFIK